MKKVNNYLLIGRVGSKVTRSVLVRGFTSAREIAAFWMRQDGDPDLNINCERSEVGHFGCAGDSDRIEGVTQVCLYSIRDLDMRFCSCTIFRVDT